MADKYGFTFQKQQYRWIHPQARHLVHPSDSDFVAAPETLVEFRRLWDLKGESPSRQFVCSLWDENGSRQELTIDTEADYQNALKFVSSGEIVYLTVLNAVRSSGDMNTQNTAFNEKNPPAWFINYMDKFRSEMMGEISELIDHKLAQKHGGGPGPAKQCGSGALHREPLSSTDFKCLKIDKKLQKLQKRTQMMSLEMDDVAPSHHKVRGERKLSKMSKRMEQLEAKRCKILARKMGRLPSAPEEVVPSVPVMVAPEVEEMQMTLSTEAASPPPSQYDACVLSEEAVLHVAVGSAFTKTWKVKNVGELPWTDKTVLRLSHATAGLTADLEKVVVPTLQPGEEGDVAVNFQAPSFPGLFETYWHLYNGEERFGQWLRCSISVDLIPGEQRFESKSLSSSSLTQHPAIKEIQEVNLSGSQIQQKENDKGEFESDEDDEDDDISSDSDDSDSFVHIPMPKCYQYKMVQDGDETGASCALDAGNQAMSTSSLASAGASLPTQPAAGSCKTPPSTPMNADSDEEETSDTTQIKYPVLDLTDMTVYPAFPPNLQAAVEERQRSQERDSSPVHILPETLVTGALNVAAKAFSSAEAIMRSIHNSSTSASSSFSASVTTPTQEAPAAEVVSGPPSVLMDDRTQNLITLSDMGFFDDRLNEELLGRYNDNLENVIADLLLRASKSR